MIEIARGLRGRDADQTFRSLSRGEQLGQALVGEAIHAHAAVRLAACAQPADGVRAIPAFAAERIELTFRIAAAADILDDNVVAVGRKPGGVRVHHRGGDVPAVGLSHQQGRMRPGARRVVVIGDQYDSV